MEPRRLADEIRSEGVTVFQTGPSVWSILLDEVQDFPRVRVAITTGEAVAPALAARLVDRGEPCGTFTVRRNHGLGDRAPPRSRGSTRFFRVPGFRSHRRSASQVLARVLDDQLQLVAPGSEGELWIGGEAVARGLLPNPELTQERFRILGTDGGRFYKTGDVVLQDAQGVLHYFGRNDDQIKVRGVRIEPMEVESALLTHPGVSQAAATWFEGSEGSRSIIAGVVPRPHVTPHRLGSARARRPSPHTRDDPGALRLPGRTAPDSQWQGGPQGHPRPRRVAGDGGRGENRVRDDRNGAAPDSHLGNRP